MEQLRLRDLPANLRRYLWIPGTWVIEELLKHRVFAWLNEAIDRGASGVVVSLRSIMFGMISHPVQVFLVFGMAYCLAVVLHSQLRPGSGLSELVPISFDYLPASPLDNGWKPKGTSGTPRRFSVPKDRPDGLHVDSHPDDVIEYFVLPHQKVCNRLRFSANQSHDAHVYAKVIMMSRDRTVSKEGWLACDAGAKEPKRIFPDEWAIYRKPDKRGWTDYDILLPDEIQLTYGATDGLKFSDFLAIRLRGTVSISKIRLFYDDRH